MAEADRLDPGWRWDDLLAARPNPPDKENAALRIDAIRKSMPRKWPDWEHLLTDADLPALPQPKDEPPGSPGADLTDVPTPEARRGKFGYELESEIFKGIPNQQIRVDQLAALRKAFAAIPEAVAKSVGLENLKAGRLPRERVRPLLNDLFPTRVQDERIVGIMLGLHSALLAQERQPDAALADCRKILAIERAANAEPMLMNALVAMAFRAIATAQVQHVLAQGEPSSEALAATRRAFEASLLEPVILEGLRGERAFFEDLVSSVDDGLLDASKAFDNEPTPNVTGIKWVDDCLHRLRGGRTWTRWKSAAVLPSYTFLIEIAKQSSDVLRRDLPKSCAYRELMENRVQKATRGRQPGATRGSTQSRFARFCRGRSRGRTVPTRKRQMARFARRSGRGKTARRHSTRPLRRPTIAHAASLGRAGDLFDWPGFE